MQSPNDSFFAIWFKIVLFVYKIIIPNEPIVKMGINGFQNRLTVP